MSIYIGDDGAGINILHVTSGVTGVNKMKEGIQPESIFHTDMQFITFDEFPVTSGEAATTDNNVSLLKKPKTPVPN
jgi:hypothetical protein